MTWCVYEGRRSLQQGLSFTENTDRSWWVGGSPKSNESVLVREREEDDTETQRKSVKRREVKE